MCMINTLLLVSGLVCFADASPLTDKEKMQGVWIVEKQDRGKVSNQIADFLPRYLRFEIKGDECTVTIRKSKDDPEESHKVTLVLDSEQKPRHFDFAVNGKTTSIKGIYSLRVTGRSLPLRALTITIVLKGLTLTRNPLRSCS